MKFGKVSAFFCHGKASESMADLSESCFMYFPTCFPRQVVG